MWDRATGIPTQVYGSGIAATGSVASARAAEAHARALLKRHLAWLAPGSKDSDFRPAANHLLRGIRSVTFQQHFGGVPVIGAYVSFAFKKDRLVLFGSRAAPHVRVSLAGARSGDAVYPLVGTTGKISFHLVRASLADSTQPLGRWIVYTDVATKREVARRSLVFQATGQILFDVPDRHPAGTRSDRPAAFAHLTVDGGGATCDVDGNVSWTGASPTTVDLMTDGTYVFVENLSGPQSTASLSLSDGGSVTWSLAADEFGDAQLSAYVHANIAKDAARVLNPGLTWVNQQMLAQVNALGNCNAFSMGDDIYFLRAGMFQGQPCQNPARIADIVMHEVGHSVHTQSVIPGMGDVNPSLSEGLSDYFATTILDDPALGEGFIGVGPLRHLDPVDSEAVWPDDIDTDTHITGLIIAGTLWDLRKALIVDLGAAAGVAHADRLFYSVMQRAPDIPSSYAAVLLEDDDDGNLANGTPNQCTIDGVFFAHGLGGAAGTAGSLVSVDGLTVTLRAPAAQPGCPTISGGELVWRVRSETSTGGTLAMTDSGGDWTADVPLQADNTVVQYQVRATTSAGSQMTFPRNAADPWYELHIGTPAMIYCTGFETDVLSEDWTATGDGGGTDWEVATPRGRADDPSSAFAGTGALGNDLTGDGLYSPNSTDIVVGPVVDVSGYDVVRLQYRRWLNVEDGQYDTGTILVNDSPAWQNLGGPDVPPHLDNEWRFHDVDLTSFATGGSVQVAFELRSDSGIEYGGWTIDELCIVGYGAGPAVDAGSDATIGPDAGGGSGGDGCGCRTSDPASAGLLLMALCLLAIRRRRA